MQLSTKPIYATNEEFRRLRSLHRLTAERIEVILSSDEWGGPSLSAIRTWLASNNAANYNRMPANSLDIFKIRLEEAGYFED